MPFDINSATGIGAFSVQNNGDVETWPIWVFTGPGQNPTLTNQTTGEILHLILTLSAGQVLTIDTRPGIKTITREDGSNQYGNLDPTSILWSLRPSLTAITAAFTSTTSASSVALRFKQRWLGV